MTALASAASVPGRIGNPLAAEKLRRVVEARVDVHELDAELLGPQPPLRALEAGIDSAGGLGIARPEHDLLGFLEAVFHGAVEARNPEAHVVAEVVHRAPVPPLPADRAEGDPGVADQIAEAKQRAQPVADVAPLVVGGLLDGDGTRAVLALHALDLAGDEIERLVPADALVLRDPAVPDVALALRIEIDALHRVQHALGRIDHRLESQRMGAHGRRAARREAPAAGVDGPARRVGRRRDRSAWCARSCRRAHGRGSDRRW